MIFERSTREQALAEIRQALSEERLNEADADALAAVATDYDVAIEWLIRFIHEKRSENTVSDFTRFAAGYRKFVDEARARRQADLFDHSPEAFD